MPISAVDCLAGSDLTEPRLSPDGRLLAHVRADAQGARIVVTSLAHDVSGRTETAHEIERWDSPWLVRAGRSLGGGCFEWMPDARTIVAVTSDGDLRLWNLDGTEHLLVDRVTGRTVSSPVPNRRGTRIAYVVDQAEVHAFDVTSGQDRRVDAGDFAFVIDPVWWRDRLVWHAWSPPHMPWDESVLVSESGVIHGGRDVQHQQAQTTADEERIGWLDDSSGWLNVVIDGVRRVDEGFEHGGPTWGDRQRSWCFDDTGTNVAFVRNEGGFGRLCTVDLETGEVVERAKAVHGQLSWRGGRLAAVRTGGRTPTQIVIYDTRANEWSRSTIEIGPSYAWSESTALVEPELVRVRARDGSSLVLHARLYRSTHGNGRLLCWMHGGPTDQWQVVFMPRLAFWIDRGYDVLVPDVRGSTGHGRAYAQALRGQWGLLDVTDAETILDDVLEHYGYESRATAVLGSSAGGLTALLVAARRPDLVSAVAVAYPVSDIAALDSVTHRFEAHYNRSLVGSVDDTERASLVRSPIACAEALAALPVLVMHGSIDPVVPIEQTHRLAESIRRHGGTVDVVEFESEGHGFRTLENRIAEFARMESFLERVLLAGVEGRQRSSIDDR